MIDKGLNYGREHISSFASRIKSAQVIVDLGAGQGKDLLLFKAAHPTASLYGVEFYEPNILQLQKNGIGTIDINIEKDKLPFENESVDVIIANQILEHCKEIWWILHEVSRVLKKGGSFIVGVPNLASFHNRALLALGKQPTCIQNNSAHVRGYTKGDFLKFLHPGKKQLYELGSFKGSNFYPFPPVLAKPLSKILPLWSVGIFFHLIKVSNYDNSFLEYPIDHSLETNFYLG